MGRNVFGETGGFLRIEGEPKGRKRKKEKNGRETVIFPGRGERKIGGSFAPFPG